MAIGIPMLERAGAPIAFSILNKREVSRFSIPNEEDLSMELSELRKKPHLSASGVNEYVECSLLYRFGRIDRLPMEFVAAELEFGTVIHKVLEEFYRAKMIGEKLLLKDLHEQFKTLWKKSASERQDIQYQEGQNAETLSMLGVDLLTAWHSKLQEDNFQVIAVEEAFSFNLPGIPAIIGAIDLLEQDESGTLIITDFKTSGRAYSVADVDRNQQLTVYQMAMKRAGHTCNEILLKFDCLIKTKSPKCESYWTTRSERDETRMARKIRQVWTGISKGVFVPNDTSWKCPRCHYKKACDEWFLNGGDE
jgi:putative RecB family exonuclease